MRHIKKLIPSGLYKLYHYAFALMGSVIYRNPSRKIAVVAVTGTKGKTSVTEILSAIFEKAGFRVAMSNGIRFKIADYVVSNTYKMTMPGRFFLQKFLRQALKANCDMAIVEMTSEGAAQYRHKFIALNALVFTNLAREHIESHGSYAKYRDAKLLIAKELVKSRKRNKAVIANEDDEVGRIFLKTNVEHKLAYGLLRAKPYGVNDSGIEFTLDNIRIQSPLKGVFNIYNCLAAARTAGHFGVDMDVIAKALNEFGGIPGRMEYIDESQPFRAIVDYAHTPDSLRAVYDYLKPKESTKVGARKLICVLGSTGGGRDKWKRQAMGQIAAEYCDNIILTNEDPYDENPEQILKEIERGIVENSSQCTLIIDRRVAIRNALAMAKHGDTVIITGKGTDPYIMGPNGTKQVWSDARVVKEELRGLLST